MNDKIEELKKNYDEKLAQKEELGNKAKQLEIKLERAGKLVSGLGGERERWEASVAVSIHFSLTCYAIVLSPMIRTYSLHAILNSKLNTSLGEFCGLFLMSSIYLN